MKKIRRFFIRLRAVWKLSRIVSDAYAIRPDNRKAVLILTTPWPDHKQAMELRSVLNDQGITNPLLLLREGIDLQTVSEDTMRRLGWHRREPIR